MKNRRSGTVSRSADLLSVRVVRAVGGGVPVGRGGVFDGRVSVVDHLVGDLGLGQLEDEHRSAEDHGEKTEGEGLPGLQSDQSQSERYQRGSLELETQQERDHHLLDEAATYEQFQTAR